MALTQQPNKRLKKIGDNLAKAVFFIFGICLISLFLYLHNSQEVIEYLKKISNNNPTAGLRLTVFYGIVKLLSIIAGSVIIIGVTYNLIKGLRKNSKAP